MSTIEGSAKCKVEALVLILYVTNHQSVTYRDLEDTLSHTYLDCPTCESYVRRKLRIRRFSKNKEPKKQRGSLENHFVRFLNFLVVLEPIGDLEIIKNWLL